MATLKIKKEYKELLEENNAFDLYVENLKKEFNNLPSKSMERDKQLRINVLEGCYSFSDFIKLSFTWRESKEGYNYWSNICTKYS